MIWHKRGKFFDPTNFNKSLKFIEFAQSPQCVVFDNFIRVYFSTRTRDEKGEYLSNIAYIDTDLNFEKIKRFSEKWISTNIEIC